MQKKIRLSFHFAFLTSVLISIIILFMSAYELFLTKDLINQINFKNKSSNQSLATLLYSVIHNDLKTDNYNAIASSVKSLITNRMLAYLVIEKASTGKVVYSTIPNLKDKDMDVAIYLLNEYKDTLGNNESSYYTKAAMDDEIIYFGFYQNSIASIFITNLTTNISYLVFIFILMGLIAAYFMAKTVTRPMRYLSENVKDFSAGHFEKRLENTNYEEIDELVVAFNNMAQSLQELYQNLEQKVKDRTEEVQNAYKELKEAQSMMVHSEKMRSLGELVAGITHEINNPVNFTYGNLIHLNNYSKDLISLISAFEEFENELSDEHKENIKKLKEEIDYNFLKEDLPQLIKSCQEGTERTKNIIADLKNFSRMEEMVVSSVDLEKEIDTTLNILHNKLKNRITIHKEYEENLPRIDAYGGQLNQVFMNILDNAAFAIKDKGDIYIRIQKKENNVIIEFEDNGSGMPEDVAKKIFDPFYTTKAPGEGTGLGLSISYKVIQRHNGSINVTSELNKGTKFTIELPIERNDAK